MGGVISEVREREPAPRPMGPRATQPSGFPRAMHRSKLPERTRSQLRQPRSRDLEGGAAGPVMGTTEMGMGAFFPRPHTPSQCTERSPRREREAGVDGGCWIKPCVEVERCR